MEERHAYLRQISTKLVTESIQELSEDERLLILLDKEAMKKKVLESAQSKYRALVSQPDAIRKIRAQDPNAHKKTDKELVDFYVSFMTNFARMKDISDLTIENSYKKAFNEIIAELKKNQIVQLDFTNFHDDSGDNIFWLVLKHNPDFLKTLLRPEFQEANPELKLPDINELHPQRGITLLMYAASNAKREMTTWLLAAPGATFEVNTPRVRCNILHLAAQQQDVLTHLFAESSEVIFPDLSERLSDFVNATDQDGATPVCMTAVTDNIEGCRLLLEKGARLDILFETGWNIFHSCSKFRANKILTWLFDETENGFCRQYPKQQLPDINANTKDGYTPLYFAVYEDNLKLMQLLMQHGAILTDDLFYKAMLQPKISQWLQSPEFEDQYPKCVKKDPLEFFLQHAFNRFLQVLSPRRQLMSILSLLYRKDDKPEELSWLYYQDWQEYEPETWRFFQLMSEENNEMFRIPISDGTVQRQQYLEQLAEDAGMPYFPIPYEGQVPLSLEYTKEVPLFEKYVCDHVTLSRLWPSLKIKKGDIKTRVVEMCEKKRDELQQKYTGYRAGAKSSEKYEFHPNHKINQYVRDKCFRIDQALKQYWSHEESVAILEELIAAMESDRVGLLAEKYYAMSYVRGTALWELYQLCVREERNTLTISHMGEVTQMQIPYVKTYNGGSPEFSFDFSPYAEYIHEGISKDEFGEVVVKYLKSMLLELKPESVNDVIEEENLVEQEMEKIVGDDNNNNNEEPMKKRKDSTARLLEEMKDDVRAIQKVGEEIDDAKIEKEEHPIVEANDSSSTLFNDVIRLPILGVYFICLLLRLLASRIQDYGNQETNEPNNDQGPRPF